jgi:hypothetical protein
VQISGRPTKWALLALTVGCLAAANNVELAYVLF